MFVKKSDGFYVDVDELTLVITESMIVTDGLVPSIFGFGPLLYSKSNGKVTRSTLTLATIFSTNPRDIIKEGDLRFLKYKKGDKFMIGHQVIKDVTHVEMMFKLLLGGGLPNIIDRRIYSTIIKNNINNNEKLDIPEILIEYMLAYLVRDGKDVTKLARVTGNEDYTFLNSRSVVMSESTFGALVFEDGATSVAVSMVRPKSAEKTSPLEYYAKL
ncbi:MAG: hypothetical protein ACRC92_11255 [Peptostreptococcaceae bacterium]